MQAMQGTGATSGPALDFAGQAGQRGAHCKTLPEPTLDSSAFLPLQALEGMVQATQGEVEQHTQALQAVRMKLAPWERQMGEVRSRMGVATSERDLLQKAHAQAQERFEVGMLHPQLTVHNC